MNYNAFYNVSVIFFYFTVINISFVINFVYVFYFEVNVFFVPQHPII
jgi:hypothetical protein